MKDYYDFCSMEKLYSDFSTYKSNMLQSEK